MKKVFIGIFLLFFMLSLCSCDLTFDNSLYKLTIENESTNELIGIKSQYKKDDIVEVKMDYDMQVMMYVFLNDEMIGTLDGTNSLQFTMPAKHSVLVLSFSNDNYYKVEVTGAIDSLMEEIKFSYKAGTKVEIKGYPVTDVSLHVFVDGKEIKMSHCEDYLGFEFIMPAKDITIHLTYDSFYGKDDYNFSDLYYWINKLDNVDKVAIYSKNYTYKEFSEVFYITNPKDISNMLAILEQPLEKIDFVYTNTFGNNEETKPQVPTWLTITYYVGEYFYSIDFFNNMLAWHDFSTSQFFIFKDPNYSIPNSFLQNYKMKTYKFEYDGLSSDIKKISDDTFVDRFCEINIIEFVPYIGDTPLETAEYYVDSKYGKIELINSTIFRLNGQYYEILSGDNYWAYTYID